MKLGQALTLQANIMLDEELMPEALHGLGPVDLREQVQRYAARGIEVLAEGESLTVERTSDKRQPWRLTWKSGLPN